MGYPEDIHGHFFAANKQINGFHSHISLPGYGHPGEATL